ncbi:hypothetical protein [Streptomyces sp. NPDC059010]|uniref:hypothetical protein n=1 Tax=Streptomyces sp. NPDC059010 TaxID=3346695 RepID=UPI0036A4A28E
MGIEGFGRSNRELPRKQPLHKMKSSDLSLVRLTVPRYVNEYSVTKKVAARLAGVRSLEEARMAVKDLAVTIDEFGPAEGFDRPVSVIGCRLAVGPEPLDLAKKIEKLPDRGPEYAASAVTELHGDETGAALQAAKAVLGESQGWGAKVARVALEGVLWTVLPTKPITSAVKLLTEAVRSDRPEPWLDLAQGQLVGAVAHLDPIL